MIDKSQKLKDIDLNDEYRRDPYGRIAQAGAALKRMSQDEFKALLRRAGTLGDDDKLTWYAGGTSELSSEVSKLAGEDE